MPVAELIRAQAASKKVASLALLVQHHQRLAWVFSAQAVQVDLAFNAPAPLAQFAGHVRTNARAGVASWSDVAPLHLRSTQAKSSDCFGFQATLKALEKVQRVS